MPKMPLESQNTQNSLLVTKVLIKLNKSKNNNLIKKIPKMPLERWNTENAPRETKKLIKLKIRVKYPYNSQNTQNVCRLIKYPKYP